MKKGFQAILFAMLTLLLLGAAVYGMAPSDSFLTLEIGGRDHTESLLLWDNGENTLYAFLPAYAELDDINLCVHEGRAWIGGVPVAENTTAGEFLPDTPYELIHRTLLRNRKSKIVFLQSENVGSIYIDTATGSMEKIHADKTQKESIRMSMYDASGREVYISAGFKDKIRGHGNSTWHENAKKSYNLYLNQREDLLGNGAAKKWVLLSNLMDKSNLRNWTVFQMAHRTSDNWNPDGMLTEVYLNGTYAGLYFLTDKVEAAENRMVLDDQDVLLNFEMTSRLDAQDLAVTDLLNGISAEVKYPKDIREDRLAEVERQLRWIVNGIRDHTIPEEKLNDYLDVDSWAWLYLIQEISENFDSAKCSLYFYIHDGRLYTGPIWDYDLTFGAVPRITAQYLYARDWVSTSFWKQLLQYPVFQEACIEKYTTDFLPVLHDLQHQQLPQMIRAIQKASERNELRWYSYYRGEEMVGDDPGNDDADQLMLFLDQRLNYLNRVWIDRIPYHNFVIRVEDDPRILTSVEDGSCFNGIEEIESRYAQPLRWIDKETGEEFDFNAPIARKTTILGTVLKQSEQEAQPLQEKLATGQRALLCVGTLGLLICFLCIWVWQDQRINRTGRN